MPDTLRGSVTASKDGKMRRLQLAMRADETRDNLEHFEPYGFSSEPFTDGKTDALVHFLDDCKAHGIVVCVDDRRYRITGMEQGEVAIFDDKERHVYLKRDGIEIDGVDDPITIKTNGDININAGGSVNITGATINLN